MNTPFRFLALALLAAALAAPAVLANHTAPANDTVSGGHLACKGEGGRFFVNGTATDQTLPLLRTTDNGHLTITGAASASVSRESKCLFEVRITGFSLVGVNPQGGLANVVSTPCSVVGSGTCTPTAEADWWVTFVDPLNNVYTAEIDVHFDLAVNGVVVDSGTVRIVEPSVPALPAL